MLYRVINVKMLTLLFGKALAVTIFIIFVSSAYAIQPTISNFPNIILWAWERPEELSFINPSVIGVAFLASTLYLQGEDVVVRPRLQPLKVPEGTSLIAVVRIETGNSKPPEFSVDQQMKAISTIAGLTHIQGVRAIQIDFDAKISERTFYRNLLLHLRRKLPESLGLSITALASWCVHDNWLKGLSVDEVVPMLFRMGADHGQIIQKLESGEDFKFDICKDSLGVSTDEAIPKLPSGRRIYIFNPKAWSKEDLQKILKEVNNEI